MTLLTVMVVDDSEADHFICNHTLKKYNPDINIIAAYDGQEALEILAAADVHPQVIFLDINMPRMNGHEFLEKYSEIYGEKNCSVVVMLTSSDQENDKQQSMAYNAVVDYFTKPLSIKAIDTLCDENKNICN
ncbi:MAG: response regulator [Lentilitoribacter sp.]